MNSGKYLYKLQNSDKKSNMAKKVKFNLKIN